MPTPPDKLYAVPPPEEEKIEVSTPDNYAAGVAALKAVAVM